MNKLLNAIKDNRLAEGMTQAELAKRVGVSRKTINTIENGVFVPSTILALKISKELGKNVEEIFWLNSD